MKLMENTFLTSKNIRLAVLGLLIAIPSFFVGVTFANNFILSAANNPFAKGATAAILVVEISEITDSTAVIRWETDQVADGQVEYGISEAYEFISELDVRPDTRHEIALINLEPDQIYHFKVRSTTPAGRLVVSDDLLFGTLASTRGQVSICGWDGDSIERTDTFCPAKDGWAKGKSWTEFCTAVWGQTISFTVEECIYQFSDVKTRGSVALNESWEIMLKPSYTGWVDVLMVSNPLGEEIYMPAAVEAQDGSVVMDALDVLDRYSFRFRPADNSASWSDVLTIMIRK